MELTINTQQLKQALQPYKKVISNKTNFILTGIKLTADEQNQTLTIEGTDLELAMRTTIKANVTTPGEIVIPFKNIENLASVNKEENTSLTLTDKNELQAYKLKLNTFDVNEFPLWQTLKPEGLKTTQDLDFKAFNTALSKTIDFVSRDESRAALTGFLLNTKDNEIVATDSYKLAIAKYDFKKNLEKEPEPKPEGEEQSYNRGLNGIVIPSRIYDLLKMIKAETFNLAVNNEAIEFTIDNLTIVTRLFSGKFPDYQRLVPTVFNYEYKIDSKTVVTILEESEKLLGNKDDLPIKIQSDHNKMLFTMVNREIGNYESEIVVETLKTENITEPLLFAVNPTFFKICLKNLTNPTLSIVEPLKPVVLQEDESLKILLMPIRIQ